MALADSTGQSACLSQFVAMPDRVFPREAAERLGCSPRRIQRWVKNGKLRKGADGKINYQAARHLHLFQKTGRPAGKPHKHEQELLGKLSKNDEQLLAPFLKATHGQRRFARLADLIALAARRWNNAKRERWREKLVAAAYAVECAKPTGARKRQRKAAAEGAAYSRDKAQFKKRRLVVERPEDVVPQLTNGDVFRFYLWLGAERPPDRKLAAELKKKIQYCLEATGPIDALQRMKKSGFKMAITERHPSESDRPSLRTGREDKHVVNVSDKDIAGEIDDCFSHMSPTELAAARAKWLRERPRIPRLQGNTVTEELINALAAHRKWQHQSPTRSTQVNRDHWLLEEICKRLDWNWQKIDDGWGWEATPPPARL
jgi:hypothetical protein